MTTLFDNDSTPPSRERLEEGAVLLRTVTTRALLAFGGMALLPAGVGVTV